MAKLFKRKHKKAEEVRENVEIREEKVEEKKEEKLAGSAALAQKVLEIMNK